MARAGWGVWGGVKSPLFASLTVRVAAATTAGVVRV
jgi:hypothetical protein